MYLSEELVLKALSETVRSFPAWTRRETKASV